MCAICFSLCLCCKRLLHLRLSCTFKNMFHICLSKKKKKFVSHVKFGKLPWYFPYYNYSRTVINQMKHTQGLGLPLYTPCIQWVDLAHYLLCCPVYPKIKLISICLFYYLDFVIGFSAHWWHNFTQQLASARWRYKLLYPGIMLLHYVISWFFPMMKWVALNITSAWIYTINLLFSRLSSKEIES